MFESVRRYIGEIEEVVCNNGAYRAIDAGPWYVAWKKLEIRKYRIGNNIRDQLRGDLR